MAIPPGLTIASYAVDGASYLGSGKSVTDHMLSDLAGRDCATWRIIKSRPICKDFTPEEIATRRKNKDEIRHDIGHAYIATSLDGIELNDGSAVAAQTNIRAKSPIGPARREPALVRQETPRPKAVSKPVDLRRAAPSVRREDLPAAGGTGTRPLAQHRTKPATTRHARNSQVAAAESRYLVFGSFRRRSEAVRFAGRHAVMKPVILPVKVRGKRYYRVVVRPGGRDALTAARHTLRRNGVKGAYTMRICRAGAPLSHCMQPIEFTNDGSGPAVRPTLGGG